MIDENFFHCAKDVDTILKTVFLGSIDAIGVSSNGISILANPSYLKLFGYDSLEEIIGEKVIVVFADEERERVNQYIALRMRGEEAPSYYKTIGKRKNGELFHMEVHVSNYQLNSDFFSVVTFRDLTSQIEQEQKNILINEYRQALFDDAPIGMLQLVSTPGGFQIFVNNYFSRFLGYSKEELENMKPDEIIKTLFLEDDVKNESSFIEKLLTKQIDNYKVEKKYKKKNGEISYGSIKTSVIPSREKDSFHTITIVQDITSRIETENALRESKESLNRLANNTPDVISRFDKNFRYIFANKNISQLYGLKAEAFIGKTHFEAGFSTEDCNELEGRLADTFQTGNIYESIYQQSVNNESRFYDWRMIPEFGQMGEVNSVLSILRDITNEKQFEKELIKAKERAEESDRLKSAFVANLSHEIRTPMNVIVGFAELLKEPEIENERKEYFIDAINQNSNLLLNLINDIIDISKIESGQITVSSSEVFLNSLISDTYEMFRFSKQKRSQVNIKIGKRIEEARSIVFTDEVKIRQILNNLVNNAIKFTHEGEIEFGYEVIQPENNTTAESLLCFYVKDTGIGISKEKQTQIFERFRQAELSTTRKYGGTGLGLAICKAYVELLGGKIWIDSDTGKGSTFFFTVPYKPTKIITQKPFEIVTQNKNIDWSSKTFLVAEDEDYNILFIKEALKHTHVKLVIVESGFDAVNECKNNPEISLVLMDIKITGIDGYEATRQIKRFKPNLPIIAQTAYALQTDREKAFKSGCDGFISKPMQKNALIAIITKYLPK